jgi:hypothetical protein
MLQEIEDIRHWFDLIYFVTVDHCTWYRTSQDKLNNNNINIWFNEDGMKINNYGFQITTNKWIIYAYSINTYWSTFFNWNNCDCAVFQYSYRTEIHIWEHFLTSQNLPVLIYIYIFIFCSFDIELHIHKWKFSYISELILS